MEKQRRVVDLTQDDATLDENLREIEILLHEAIGNRRQSGAREPQRMEVRMEFRFDEEIEE